MKKNFEKIMMLLIVVIMFSSCASLTHMRVKFSSTETKKIDKMALISTYLNIRLPVVPLLDAAIMNETTNSISDGINLLFKDNIDIMRDSVARLLQNTLKCNVIFGEALHGMPGFKEVKEKYNFEDAMANGYKNFPKIISAKDDFNPFKFEKGNVQKYFKDPNNYMTTISKICEGLNLNYIAVSLSEIAPAPGSLMSSSTLFLATYLYLFDKKGNCIASGSNFLTPIKFKASEVDGYQQSIDTFSATLRPIIKKIGTKYGNY
jgi:hypothetical protein